MNKKLETIQEEGKIFNSIEFGKLGGMSRKNRRNEIIKKIIKFTNKTLDYANIALWELDNETSTLHPLFSRGYGNALRKYSLKSGVFDSGIVGYVAHVGYPYISRNVSADPHYLSGIKEACSCVAVPFKVGKEVFGVLNIESPKRSAFFKDDIAILREYSGYVAVALNIKRILDIQEEITISRVSKTLAHEINNPLESIFMAMARIDSEKENLSKNMIGMFQIVNHNLHLIKTTVAKLSAIKEPEVDEEHEIYNVEERLAGRRILIIEDEVQVRESMKQMLKDERCIVSETGDGIEGINLALRSDFDVVITDIRLPSSSGYEVFKAIRKARKDQTIIMMTGFGYDEAHSIVKGNEDGLNGVLYKPFTPELLKKVLCRVCE